MGFLKINESNLKIFKSLQISNEVKIRNLEMPINSYFYNHRNITEEEKKTPSFKNMTVIADETTITNESKSMKITYPLYLTYNFPYHNIPYSYNIYIQCLDMKYKNSKVK